MLTRVVVVYISKNCARLEYWVEGEGPEPSGYVRSPVKNVKLVGTHTSVTLYQGVWFAKVCDRVYIYTVSDVREPVCGRCGIIYNVRYQISAVSSVSWYGNAARRCRRRFIIAVFRGETTAISGILTWCPGKPRRYWMKFVISEIMRDTGPPRKNQSTSRRQRLRNGWTFTPVHFRGMSGARANDEIT